MGSRSDREALLAANQAFYDAFDAGDLDALEALWAEGEGVACIHPGWPALHGREAVIGSWRTIFASGGAPDSIRCAAPVPFVSGDLGFVVCNEELDEGLLVATNVFRRQDGVWRLLHHQAGSAPPPVTRPGETVH